MGDGEERRALQAPAGWELAALERLPIPVAAVGAGRRILFWNGACARVTGYPRAEALADPGFLRRLYPGPGHLERLEAALGTLGDGAGAPAMSTLDDALHTSDGRRRSIAWTVLDSRTETGTVWILGHDLTDHLVPGEDLRQVEKRYRMLVEHGRDLIALHDLDGRYRYLSPAVEPLLGYRADELLGANAYDFLHPDDGSRVPQATHQQVLAGKIQTTARYRFRRKDGSYAWIETVGVPLYEDPDDPGRVTSTMTTSRDVSADVAATERLVLSEERLRLAMLAAGIGWYEIYPQQWSRNHYSDEYLRQLGYGPEDRELFTRGYEPRIHPDDAALVLRTRRTVEAGQLQYDGEFRRMHRSGRYRWQRTVGRVLETDHQGRALRLVGTVHDIDDSKRAAQKLLAANLRLARAQALAHVGDWNRTFSEPEPTWSEETFRILGYEPGAIAPSRQAFLARVHPDERDALDEFLQTAWGEAQEVGFDSRIVWPDGTVRSVHHTGQPQRDDQGRLNGYAGTIQDITERKAVEEALRAATAELEQAQRRARIGSWRRSLVDGSAQWSPTLYEIAGLDASKPPPTVTEMRDLCTPESWARWQTSMQAAAGNGAPHSVEYELVRPDGAHRWVLSHAEFERAADGTVVAMVGTSQDITERKKAEDDLRKAAAELERAQGIANMGSWQWNVGDEAAQWSPSLLKIYARDPAGPPPTFAEMQNLLTPDSWARLQAAVAGAVEHGRGYSVELEVVRPDGTHRWVTGQAEVECDAQGQTLRLVGTALDITDRKRSELELSKARDEVRALSGHFEDQLEQERKRIAMDVHDEVGQMLSAMKHELQLLQVGAVSAGGIERRIGRLNELVDNSIEVTRNVALNLRPPALDLGLSAALEWLAEDFELRSEIGCDVRVRGGDAPLDDRQATALFRIAQESLTNVARHAGAKRVQIELDGAPDRLLMAIRDDGCGFDLEAARAQGHFGLLGMNERAWRIGAALEIQTRPGHGTSVRVELRSLQEGTT